MESIDMPRRDAWAHKGDQTRQSSTASRGPKKSSRNSARRHPRAALTFSSRGEGKVLQFRPRRLRSPTCGSFEYGDEPLRDGASLGFAAGGRALPSLET